MVTTATAISSGRASSLVPLDREFFEQPVVALARALLGKLLVRRLGRMLLVGRIAETEAYGGQDVDPSAHSFRGPTPRCAVMFGPAGHAYVYTTHQGRCCLNVSATGDRAGKAVLLRAIEPLAGIEHMRRHRLASLADGPTRSRLLAGVHARELAAGPARLCACLAVDRAQNGADITDVRSPLFIAAPAVAADVADVLWTPRIGLNPASASCGWCWRALDARSPVIAKAGRGTGTGRRRPAGARRAPRPRECPPRTAHGVRRARGSRAAG